MGRTFLPLCALLLAQTLHSAVVTEGFIRFGPPRWEFSGDGFRATGGFNDHFISWQGGPRFNVFSLGLDIRSGPGLSSASVGGVDYPLIYWGLSSTFLAETDVSAPLPPGRPGRPGESVTFTAPFTFTANLCGLLAPRVEPVPCEFELALTGSGITTVNGFYYESGDEIRLFVDMANSGMRFTAIPEPGAGALMAAGIAAMLAVFRRMRQIPND
jgi:hypothetical protein